MAESGEYTPETLARRAKVAEAMMAKGTGGEPIQHWAQGLSKLAHAGIGGYGVYQAEQEQKAGQNEAAKALVSLLLGEGASAGASPASPVPSGEPAPPPPTSPRPYIQAEPPEPPSPYKLAGMAPLNSQDTFNTPLDVMAPRSQVASALRGATGAPPPMSGMTPAGATPVPTQSITPPPASPAPAAMSQRPISAPVATAGVAPDEGRAKIAAMLQSRNPYVQQLGQKLAASYIKPQEPSFDKLNDDTLFNKKTGETKPVGPGYRPLTSPEERAAHGIPAEDKRPYQVGPGNKLINPPAETRLTVDQRGEGEFTKKAAGHVADRFNDYVKAGDTARENVANLEALREIGTRFNTGKAAEIKAALGPYAEALGVKIDHLGDMQAYQSITAKIAPQLRVPGSGSTSDYEMKQYLDALPTLGKTPEGNKIVADTNQAIMAHRQALSEIGSRALAGELSPREAEKAARELPDPMAMWKKSRGASPAAPATRAPASGKTGSGVQWSVQ